MGLSEQPKRIWLADWTVADATEKLRDDQSLFISETAIRAVYDELREGLLDTPSCDYRDGMRLAMGKIRNLLEGK